MVRFGESNRKRKVAESKKNTITILDVNVDNIVHKFVETKTHSKYLIGYSNKSIRPLVLIISKMRGYVKTFEFNPIQDGGGQKAPLPYQFSPLSSANVRISPQNLLVFSFNPFDRLV